MAKAITKKAKAKTHAKKSAVPGQKKKPGARNLGSARPRGPVLEPRISFLTIGTRDFKVSLEFYRDIVGFPLYQLQGDIAMFDIGGMVFALYPHGLLAEDAHVKPGPAGFGGVTMAYNVRRSSDVDGVLKKLEDRGVRILKPAENTFWGGRSGYFADPDGVPWEVAWNPFIKMDAKGRLVLKKKS